MLSHRYWVASYILDRMAHTCHFYLPKSKMIFTHADAHFRSSTVAASAESVGGSTPGARVTWRTTVLTECVTSVRVNFETTPTGGLAASYTTTNASRTEVIQTGLQCGTNYYITVVVSGTPRHEGVPVVQFLLSNKVQVFIGGKEMACMRFQSQKPDGGYFIAHAAIPIPFGVRAEVTADNTSVRVSWGWLCQGELHLVRVHYRPEGGSKMMYTVGNTPVTSSTLPNLHCNTEYTIWVHASGGQHNSRSLPRMVNLPARGMFMLYTV